MDSLVIKKEKQHSPCFPLWLSGILLFFFLFSFCWIGTINNFVIKFIKHAKQKEIIDLQSKTASRTVEKRDQL